MEREIRKTAAAEFQAVAKSEAEARDQGPGVFRALVSVFGNVDSDGEVVDKGAFSKTLEERPRFPIFWSHQFDAQSIVGYATKAEETDEGLLVEWRALDTEAGRAVAELLKSGAVTDFSFSAVVRDSVVEKADGDDGEEVRHLTELDLWEAGPCIRGANPRAKIVSDAEPEESEGDADDSSDTEEKAPGSEDAEQRKARARLALLGL